MCNNSYGLRPACEIDLCRRCRNSVEIDDFAIFIVSARDVIRSLRCDYVVTHRLWRNNGRRDDETSGRVFNTQTNVRWT